MPSTNMLHFMARDFTLTEYWQSIGVDPTVLAFEVAVFVPLVQAVSNTWIAEATVEVLEQPDDSSHGNSTDYGSNFQVMTLLFTDGIGEQFGLLFCGPKDTVFVGGGSVVDVTNTDIIALAAWIIAHGMSPNGVGWGTFDGGSRSLTFTPAQALLACAAMFGAPLSTGQWYIEDGMDVQANP